MMRLVLSQGKKDQSLRLTVRLCINGVQHMKNPEISIYNMHDEFVLFVSLHMVY